MSRYGGVSAINGRAISLSGDCAATEASLERKGSWGLIGGIGILAAALTRKAFEFFLPDEFKEREGGGEERGSREFIDACKQDAMVKKRKLERMDSLPEDLAMLSGNGRDEMMGPVFGLTRFLISRPCYRPVYMRHVRNCHM